MTRRPIHLPTRRVRTIRDQPHGQVLALFALLLVVLLAVSALAVDYGSWLLARRGMQNIADAASLVGASQLTSDPTLACPTDTGALGSQVGESCAKQAAWQYIKDKLGFTLLDPALQTAQDPKVPYTAEKGYTIWVASPPSEAASAYPANGHFKDNPMTVFVRIEQPQASGLGHYTHPNDVNVGAWATAGRVAQSYAIIALCKPNGGQGKTCLAQDADIKIDGGSQVIVPTGDVGANTWTVTNGQNDLLELGSDSGAYEGMYTSCWGSANCHLVGYPDTTSDRQAIPLGLEITDPAYPVPGNSVSSSTMPAQCGYSGSIAAAPGGPGPMTAANGGPTVLESADLVLAAAVGPGPTGSVGLGAAKTTIKGTITDANSGATVSGAVVTITGTGGPYTQTTTATGAYSIDVTTGGTFTVTVTKSGYNSATASVTVASSTTVTKNFALVPLPASLAGTVKSGGGVAIVGAVVTLSSGGGTATTTSGGVYSITNITPGTYTVTVTAAGYTTFTQVGYVIAPGASQTLNVTMTQSGGIAGTVTDAGTGLPLANVTVTAGTYSTATLANGTYSLSAMTPGTYSVTFTLTGYTTATTNNVVVTSGSTATVNKALVSNSGTLRGTVTDQLYGVPVSGATVTINGQSATTNASGQYTIPGVAAGSYTVTATAVGYFDFSSPSKQSISGGATTTYNFTMGPSTCVRKANGTYTAGTWTMCQSGASLDTCYTPISPSNGALSTSGDVTCTAFTRANRITPGTYTDITIPAGACAWIDPIPDTLSPGQIPGVVHVTGNLQLGNNAVLFGDGVTIVMDSGSQLLVGNSSLFVINYATVYNTATGACSLGTASTTFGSPRCFRTHPGSSMTTGNTSNGYYDGNDYSYGAWTTTGIGLWSKSSFTWPVCGTHASVTWDQTYPSCVTRSAIGMAFYLRPGSSYETKRFAQAGAWGFLFMGVLYGPKDNINLGGQGDQASAGQIVSWTLEYHGGTQIQQRYSGIKVDGPPYLMEPTLGQ